MVLLLASLAGAASYSFAGETTLTARIAIEGADRKRPSAHRANDAVVWLKPLAEGSTPAASAEQHPRLVQRHKTFEPHLLVVPVGSVVEFPNRDPFFHNVFSLFEGKRFDLGLYEAGSTRGVRFDKPGVSYIFCNIHAEMSAVIVTLDTPYYGISNESGEIVIRGVPPGRYTMQVWYESALPEKLKSLTRIVTVSEDSSTLGVVRLTAATLPAKHKNKYGQDYEPPSPDSPAYERQ